MKYLNPLKLKTIAATLVAFAFIASAVAPLRAQQPAPGQDKGTSRSKVERKNRAPVSKDGMAAAAGGKAAVGTP